MMWPLLGHLYGQIEGHLIEELFVLGDTVDDPGGSEGRTRTFRSVHPESRLEGDREAHVAEARRFPRNANVSWNYNEVFSSPVDA